MTTEMPEAARHSSTTITDLRHHKVANGAAPLVMITAYDAPFARLAEAAGVDLILVGDSVGTTVLGYDSTTLVTLDDMAHHARAARRGASDTQMVVDLPFGSYEASDEQAVASARRLIDAAGADAVKLEGGARMANRIRAITGAGIPVVGHVGLLPQTAAGSGGMRVRGRTIEEARTIMADARAVADAGATLCVLEMVPAGLAARITAALPIPTIGIGAGVHCDGQVLVINDLLGMDRRFSPRFLKRYADLEPTIRQAISAWARDVRRRDYPGQEHSFALPDDVADALDDAGSTA